MLSSTLFRRRLLSDSTTDGFSALGPNPAIPYAAYQRAQRFAASQGVKSSHQRGVFHDGLLDVNFRMGRRDRSGPASDLAYPATCAQMKLLWFILDMHCCTL
jgi:hypothetical protein